MVSEENLEYLRERNAHYIVGTPKARLRQFEAALLDQKDWCQVQEGVEVKLLDHPEAQGQERYVLCRSAARHQKESAMLQRQLDGLRGQLQQIDRSLRKRPAQPEAIERRIGTWMGRYTAAAKVFTVEVLCEAGEAVGLRIDEDRERLRWASAAQGAYLLRTNCAERDPCELWRWYIQLTEIEDAFRIGKSDLGLRPVFHQREDRVQGHIFICFIALALWRSMELWLQSAGLGDCARQVLDELDAVRSMDVILPVRDQTEVRLRLVGKPDPLAAALLERMDLRLPSRPRQIQNVVDKNTL
jgi:transposase